MATASRYTLHFPVRLILYRYKDVPAEWHATCLEFAAFGWGRTPVDALEEVAKTISGEFAEVLARGISDAVPVGPDPEWDQAYREGRHPIHDDIVLVVHGTGKVSITIGRGRPRATVAPDITLESSLPPQAFQHA